MTSAVFSLPADLAPTLRERCLSLVSQVGLAAPHPDPHEGGGLAHRCSVCGRRGGKMSGHHVTGRYLVWVHRGCHRQLHRRQSATGRDCR